MSPSSRSSRRRSTSSWSEYVESYSVSSRYVPSQNAPSQNTPSRNAPSRNVASQIATAAPQPPSRQPPAPQPPTPLPSFLNQLRNLVDELQEKVDLIAALDEDYLTVSCRYEKHRIGISMLSSIRELTSDVANFMAVYPWLFRNKISVRRYVANLPLSQEMKEYLVKIGGEIKHAGRLYGDYGETIMQERRQAVDMELREHGYL